VKEKEGSEEEGGSKGKGKKAGQALLSLSLSPSLLVCTLSFLYHHCPISSFRITVCHVFLPFIEQTGEERTPSIHPRTPFPLLSSQPFPFLLYHA